MKTDELIAMLGTNVEPVKGGQLRNALVIALVVGAAAAFCLMLAIFGMPASTLGWKQVALKALALAFTLTLAAAGAKFLVGSARPGEPGNRPLILIGLLFLVLLAAAAVALALAHPLTWGGMVFAPQWGACLFCIPLFAIVPFAALVLGLRRGAPTNLRRTGAVAGMVAGSLGAAVLAFHHPAGSIPFIAIWYGGAIVLCALIGALLGPRLLRW